MPVAFLPTAAGLQVSERVRRARDDVSYTSYDYSQPRLQAHPTRSAQTCNGCAAPRRSFVSAARRASWLCKGWLPRRSRRRASPTSHGSLLAQAHWSLARSRPRRVHSCAVAPHQGNVLVCKLKCLCRSTIPRALRRLANLHLTTRGQARPATRIARDARQTDATATLQPSSTAKSSP